MRILAIDPGNTESGWCVIDPDTRKPIAFGKNTNDWLRDEMMGGVTFDDVEKTYVEMVASYGMPVGREVFETCVWIGRFDETRPPASEPVELVYRRAVKDHHCDNQPRAKDSNVRQALVDRFAPGQPNHGKGTKTNPGWFHGFRADIWQAYALAVYAADTLTTAATESAAVPA